MATLSLASPGVEINERDLSVIARPSGGTTVFLTGFANQGPTDEIISVGSISEFENTFGVPTNAAERYLYQSARQLLTQSPASVLVTRMPYGSGTGAGFSNQYSALVYPLSSDATTYASSSSFKVLAPQSVLLTDDQYLNIVENNVTWATGYSATNSILTFNDISTYGGIIVLNSAKTTIDDLYEGYYIGIADNLNNNPATDFYAITGIKAATSIDTNNVTQKLSDVPKQRLNFTLTQYATAAGTSISKKIEQFPTKYDFGTDAYNDSLTLMLFKVRTSIYNQDTVVLDSIVSEGYTGSLNANRTQNNQNGGAPVSFFLDNIANQVSSNIKVVTNPYVSNTGTWLKSDGNPAKSVRVADEAKNLYSQGVYARNTDTNANVVGNIPQKLGRILNNVDNLDIDLDITIEAGLGTIWAVAKNTSTGEDDSTYTFDDTKYVELSSLKTQTNSPITGIGQNYQDVINQFVSFAGTTRKDHIFIADGLRNIFVQGSNSKAADSKSYIFSKDIYWPLKNLFAGTQSSYAVTYGNWLKVNDLTSNQKVWVPSSGWVATVIAQTTTNVAPWSAPAGFNRGSLTNLVDVAINPTQNQRDYLYKINVNPIAFFPGDGYVIFGQKTQLKQPSAFDRINVRRLFLSLEKTTKRVLKYFLFEPNTFVTRTRLVNALKPSFDIALNSEGVYAYKIVCDERNNPPSVIDNNQLNISIYIQPVRTAEFILCDFIATPTGIDFNELIGNNQF